MGYDALIVFIFILYAVITIIDKVKNKPKPIIIRSYIHSEPPPPPLIHK